MSKVKHRSQNLVSPGGTKFTDTLMYNQSTKKSKGKRKSPRGKMGTAITPDDIREYLERYKPDQSFAETLSDIRKVKNRKKGAERRLLDARPRKSSGRKKSGSTGNTA